MDHEETVPPDRHLPHNILVDVSTYDTAHERQLQNLPCWPVIQRMLTEPQRIPRSQFLAYTLFRYRDVHSADELMALLHDKERILLNTTLRSSANSLCVHPGVDPTRRRPELQELGEAAGLCVADIIFSTTEMDWEPIKETNSLKTLDYYTAGDSDYRVELECKGTLVENRKIKCSAISNFKGKIEEKKAANVGTDAFRLGTITAFDKDPNGRPHVWLLDPPAAVSPRPPRDVRLLSRMRFLSHWLSFVRPTSSVTAAMATRVADLESIPTPSLLDGIALRDGRGKAFDLLPDPRRIHSRFFSTRSIVVDSPVGGTIVPIRSAKYLFFLGISQDLVNMSVAQEQQDILSYHRGAAVVEKDVTGVFSQGRFHQYGFNPESRLVRQRGGGYFDVDLRGPLHFTAGGLVFGWLPKPDDL